jgi:hypothetical protein
VWVTARRDRVEEAVKRHLFARAFKTKVLVPDTLADDIAAGLREDLRQSLSLANKAGVVITGFAKLDSAIAEKPVVALIHATEAAEDGRRKLANQLRKRLGGAISGFPVIQDLSNDELGLALGRANVIHAALVAGAGSHGFLNRWHRYRTYCGIEAEPTGLEGEAVGLETETGEPTIMQPAGSERNE